MYKLGRPKIQFLISIYLIYKILRKSRYNIHSFPLPIPPFFLSPPKLPFLPSVSFLLFHPSPLVPSSFLISFPSHLFLPPFARRHPRIYFTLWLWFRNSVRTRTWSSIVMKNFTFREKFGVVKESLRQTGHQVGKERESWQSWGREKDWSGLIWEVLTRSRLDKRWSSVNILNFV